jgi:MFS transporter, MCT family, solute carrier family 16 (monocarboxylic acid transporters), member 3
MITWLFLALESSSHRDLGRQLVTMSTTTTATSVLDRPYEAIELAQGGISGRQFSNVTLVADEPSPESRNIASAIPDGGYGWVVVFSCFWLALLSSGLLGAWGVIQAALLESSLRGTPTATVTFIGSLGLACVVALALLASSLMRVIGGRLTSMLGIILLGLGEITSSWTTSNVGGLFGTSGVLIGAGTCLCYITANNLPPQYFSGRLGLANGLIKLGGGVGATVLSIALEALIQSLGISWMYRVLGLLTLATGLPAAWLIKERSPPRNAPFVDWDMFRSLPFAAIFLASALGTFAVFIPPYFLPLFARSAGLSSRTGAGLVAGFNACGCVGRFVAGPICDKIGPVNTFLSTMILNASSVLAIWTLSNSIGPLTIFVVLNGIANGAFFTTLPTVVASMVGPGLAAVAMSMNITGWTFGYLLGTPIAGYLLETTGADKSNAINAYLPAIFYAGGMYFVSFLCVLLARIKLDRKLAKKI